MNNLHSLLIVLVTAGVTILLRFLPFLVFKNSIQSGVRRSSTAVVFPRQQFPPGSHHGTWEDFCAS